jgi:nicotinamide-nucleotide amidase
MAKAEIVSIGTELLLGQILDTNSQFISTELANLGVDCLFRSTVGDNSERIIECLKIALERSDVVITTGGLGPTADDLTHECIATLFKVDMEFDEDTLARIQGFFQRRGIVMVDSNRKQAYRPKGAAILPNPTGTAPGIMWSLTESQLNTVGISNPQVPRYILTFPGVPSEMKRMWSESARNFLSSRFGPSLVWSQELKHYGIGESTLAEKFGDLLHGTNPTVAPLAGTGECRLRVSAKAATEEEARQIAQPVIDRIKAGSGTLCYGIDSDTLESVVAAELRRLHKTVAAAESCTGGLLSKRLTDLPGSSAYVKLNVVTYANEAKRDVLGVSQELLDTFGAVSSECAESMAQGIRKLANADFGIGITGIAGPEGGTDEKPVGLVYIALANATGVQALKCQFPQQLGRDGIRHRSVSEALNMLRLHLLHAANLSPVK